jgi:hypothetical protein
MHMLLRPRYKLQCFNEFDKDFFRRMLEKEVEKVIDGKLIYMVYGP